MIKQVGFRRDIRATWFDAAAALRDETEDVDEIRTRLDALLAPEIIGPENRAITVQILLRIWAKPDPEITGLHREAVDRFSTVEDPADRVWLHYGVCLLTYPFFRTAAGQAGLLLRQRGVISTASLKERLIADLGQLGSLDNATKAVMFALRQWSFVEATDRRGSYRACQPARTTDPCLEGWLLTCALQSHPADGLPVGDLLAWTALFPFRFTLSAEGIRQVPGLEIQRQGGNVDIVRIAR